MLGDWLFKRTKRGRLVVSCTGILMGTVFLVAAMTRPLSQPFAFEILVGLAAIFMPLAAANAMLSFMEQIGSAAAPAIAGLIAVRGSLGAAILGICTSAWAVCFVFMILAAVFAPRDTVALRGELQARAR